MLARENPFASHRLESLPCRLALSWEELLERCAALGHRAALVGPHGSGKTTLLAELSRRLAAGGLRPRRVILRRGDSALTPADRDTLFADPAAEDLLVVDGAEQLDRRSFRQLERRSRSAAGLLVTSHEPGLLPTLHRCRSTPQILAEIVRTLVGEGEAAALAPRLAELFTRHQGNLHEILRQLYLDCARR